MTLKLVLTSERMIGGDTLQDNTRMQRTSNVLGDYIPDQVIFDRHGLVSNMGLFLICSGQDGPITTFGPKLGFKVCPDRGQRSNGHGIMYYTIRSGLKVQ